MFKIWAGSLDLLNPKTVLHSFLYFIPVKEFSYCGSGFMICIHLIICVELEKLQCASVCITQFQCQCFHIDTNSMPKGWNLSPGMRIIQQKEATSEYWLPTRFTEFVPRCLAIGSTLINKQQQSNSQPIQAKGQLIVMNGLVGSTGMIHLSSRCSRWCPIRSSRVLIYWGLRVFLGCRTSKFQNQDRPSFQFQNRSPRKTGIIWPLQFLASIYYQNVLLCISCCTKFTGP